MSFTFTSTLTFFYCKEFQHICSPTTHVCSESKPTCGTFTIHLELQAFCCIGTYITVVSNDQQLSSLLAQLNHLHSSSLVFVGIIIHIVLRSKEASDWVEQQVEKLNEIPKWPLENERAQYMKYKHPYRNAKWQFHMNSTEGGQPHTNWHSTTHPNVHSTSLR